MVGAPHVSPPSVERATSMALLLPAVNEVPVVDSAIWKAVPFGANAAHGSVARW